MKFIVYKATNKITGKCYVGKTASGLQARKRGHLDYAKVIEKATAIFHKAIHSYGPDNFQWEILEECSDHAHMCEREMHHIKACNSMHPNGYNMTAGGGTYGYKIPQETRDKISTSVKALHKDPEYQAKTYPKLKGIEPPNKGEPMPEEQKKLLSDIAKARYSDPNYVNPNEGQKRTGKALDNVREGHKRRKMPTGDAWKAAHDGQITDEAREKMRLKKLGKKPANTKKVRCLETGEVFDGLTEAAEKMGLPRQSIWMQIKGKLKHVRGFTFEYVS